MLIADTILLVSKVPIGKVSGNSDQYLQFNGPTPGNKTEEWDLVSPRVMPGSKVLIINALTGGANEKCPK